MTKQRRRRYFPRRLCLLLLAAVALAAFVRWDNSALQTTEFDLALADLPEGFAGFRAVVLSDFHGAEFGRDNSALFDAVQAAKPEAIFLLGDLIDRYRKAPDGYAETVADGLCAIAPTYYVTGNHEWALGEVAALKETLSAHGVTVLSNCFVPLHRGGDSILLAGIDDPNGHADQKTPEALAGEIAETGAPFWLLLAHRNDRFAPQYSALGADLVLSGHGHGGIIRLPFTDGLLSTDRTFFPSFTAGEYRIGDAALFVTRGLGNSGPSLRLFNRPEVAVLTLRSCVF